MRLHPTSLLKLSQYGSNSVRSELSLYIVLIEQVILADPGVDSGGLEAVLLVGWGHVHVFPSRYPGETEGGRGG
jgi:hypothetical protein